MNPGMEDDIQPVSSDQSPTTKVTKQDIAKELSRQHGNIVSTALELGVTTTRVKEAIRSNPKLQAVIDHHQDIRLDAIKERVLKSAEDSEDTTDAKFVLKHLHGEFKPQPAGVKIVNQPGGQLNIGYKQQILNALQGREE